MNKNHNIKLCNILSIGWKYVSLQKKTTETGQNENSHKGDEIIGAIFLFHLRLKVILEICKIKEKRGSNFSPLMFIY